MKIFAVIALLGSVLSGCAKTGDPFVSATRTIGPSVVLLTMQVPAENGKGWDDSYATGIVVGSGPWGSDVLTVEHAVDRARGLQITTAKKRRYHGRIVAQNTKLDLALVRVDAVTLPPATLGDSTQLQAGQAIGIMGYPIPDAFAEEGLGLAASVDSGRISSFRTHALELNVPIVPGESGGPVFAEDGAVIGVAESRFDEERSIGFALPIEEARTFLHGRAHGF